MTAGIVLAGGRSSRFGADKLQAPMADGHPLLAHAVAPLLAVCSTVAVVIGRDAAPPEGLPDDLVLVRDPEAFGGPVVGLRAGLEALSLPDRDIALLAGGDMPDMDRAVLRLLQDALRSDDAADCARLEVDLSGPAGTMAVMPCAVRSGPALAAARTSLAAGDRRLRGALDRLATVVVPRAAWRGSDPTGSTLRDIDVPADLSPDRSADPRAEPRATARDPRTHE